MSIDTPSKTTLYSRFLAFTKTDSLASRNYLPRTLGFSLLALLGFSQWWSERTAPTVHILTLFIASFLALVWSHLALLLASQASDTRAAEYRNLAIDSFIGGSFICFQSFGLWQTQAILTVLCANNMSLGGGKLFVRGFVFMLLGICSALILVGFHFVPYSGIITAVVSISFSFAYTVFTNNVSFRQARSLIKARQRSEEQSREILRQAAVLTEQASEIEIANTALQEKNVVIETERSEIERLLLNVLPTPIAKRLRRGEQTIADSYDSVSVLFADIVDFTKLSASTTPAGLVSMLDTLFSRFDSLAEVYGLEKIKTIGDAYMVVGGLPIVSDDHSERIARFALGIQSIMAELANEFALPNLSVRIGIHRGPVVAGVIGKKKFAYDLWGDTVNTASRMESHGEAGKIHCSSDVYEILKEKFMFEERGEIEVKGKGMLRTWFLTGFSA